MALFRALPDVSMPGAEVECLSYRVLLIPGVRAGQVEVPLVLAGLRFLRRPKRASRSVRALPGCRISA